MSDIPSKARAVIIGGGVSGCSVAYHLAKLGWKDVVLLERKQLSCGTTWHAAGLIGQLRASANMTRLAKYTADLYAGLEEETGLATGFSQRGSISLALTAERREELLRNATMARAYGVAVEEISPAEAKERYPHLEVGDVTCAILIPGDGQADPANVTQALAKGARQKGVKIVEGAIVTGIRQKDGRVTGVDVEVDGERTHIEAEHVVNCAGIWAREVGQMAGVVVPLHACEHFYIVTEAIPGLERLPVLRVTDECAYYKEDAGKLMLGAFEPKAKPWPPIGQSIPKEFCFDQLPEDFDHFEPILEMAVKRMPLLAEAGIHTFFNGPESFTPDDRYYLGQAPELANYWVAAGYNSVGIQSSGGAGMVLAQWMEDGEPPFDVWDVDIRRVQPFQVNRAYLRERVSETLGLLYADHFPHRQPVTSRGVCRSPVHEQLKAAGAVFGETAGWERANWFANDGQEKEYRYSWKRQNWFDNQRAEHMAVREGVGLFDMTSFGKIRVEGRDACTFLQKLCANDIDVEAGRIVYTQMLNARGGIESDLTVTRLSETAFLLVVPGATLQRDLAWLRRHAGEQFVVVTDITAAEAVFAIMGPKARELMQAVSPNDFSNTHHPFGTMREIEIGFGMARAHRVTYVGELGWELYVSSDQAAHVFETLTDAGTDHGLKLAGLHALDSCRIEKAFRHFGHDITDEDHVLEAGLGFAVKTKKGDFIGRNAVLRKK
ncbi:MAG: FAD-dependent oxidoreductase, partial [Salaquimonas sp.]|nr:FAD-dependent oxidoreductase [Salaquimonas sp.]